MRGAHEAQLQLDAITRSHVHTFYLHIFLCVNISALSRKQTLQPLQRSGLLDFSEVLVILHSLWDDISLKVLDFRTNIGAVNPGNVVW